MIEHIDELLYWYRAKVVRVVDGDTVSLSVDLGFSIQRGSEENPISYRLAGINAPETRGQEREFGLRAKIRLQELLPIGSEVALHTFRLSTKKKEKVGKYGRYIAQIWPVDSFGRMAEEPVGVTLAREGLVRLAKYD